LQQFARNRIGIDSVASNQPKKQDIGGIIVVGMIQKEVE
jgi:hypothetical protein